MRAVSWGILIKALAGINNKYSRNSCWIAIMRDNWMSDRRGTTSLDLCTNLMEHGLQAYLVAHIHDIIVLWGHTFYSYAQ